MQSSIGIVLLLAFMLATPVLSAPIEAKASTTEPLAPITDEPEHKQMANSIWTIYQYALTILPGDSFRLLTKLNDNLTQSIIQKYIILTNKISVITSRSHNDSTKTSAMKSLGAAVMAEACEWLQKRYSLTVDCTKHAQTIFETLGLWMDANDIYNFLGEEVDERNNENPDICGWVACNLNPLCGGTATEAGFEFIKKQFPKCIEEMIDNCTQCSE